MSLDWEVFKLFKIATDTDPEADAGSEANYKPQQQWDKKYKAKEEEASKSREETSARTLQQLHWGKMVSIHNLLGNSSLHWDQTKIAVEIKQFKQNVVKSEGPGRIPCRSPVPTPKPVPQLLQGEAITMPQTNQQEMPIHFDTPNSPARG